MAQNKGQTGNPLGKPKGVKNKLTIEIKERINNYVNENFDNFQADLLAIEDKSVKAKLYLEMCKLIIPKPVDPIEKEKEQIFKETLLKRFFPEE